MFYLECDAQGEGMNEATELIFGLMQYVNSVEADPFDTQRLKVKEYLRYRQEQLREKERLRREYELAQQK